MTPEIKATIDRVRELNAKATKGPWRESKISSIRVCAEDENGDSRGVVSYGGEHCGTFIPTMEAYANTHLIATYRTAAPALADALEITMTAIEAANRLLVDRYLPWHSAGGVNDCAHGYGEGIPCRKCDQETVTNALAQLNTPK